MDKFANLISTLTAMRTQGYSSQQMFDIWNISKKNVLVCLEKDLVIAVLNNNQKLCNTIRSARVRVNRLGVEIQKGILE